MTASALQNAAANRPRRRPDSPASPGVSLSRRGFTLIEMLIVMGIIILAVTLAIPTIRYLTGSKSEEAAQNTIAAVLSRTRADAIGLQQITGVLFYLDLVTDRVTLCEVKDTGFEAGDPNGVIYLDLVPDRDTLKLPQGLRLRTLKDGAPSSVYVDPMPNARYLGFNDGSSSQFNIASAPTFDLATLGGVILFDSNGRLVTRQYGFRLVSHPAVGGPAITTLQRLLTSAPIVGTSNWPAPAVTPMPYLRSQIAFSIFDRESFLNQVAPGGTKFTDFNTQAMDSGGKPVEQDIASWIDLSATIIMVNRYNGTLVKAE